MFHCLRVFLGFLGCSCFLGFWEAKTTKHNQENKPIHNTEFFVDFLVFLGCLVFLVVLVASVSLVALVFSVLRGVHSTNRTSETYHYTTIPPHAGAATTAHAGGSRTTERTGTPSRE